MTGGEQIRAALIASGGTAAGSRVRQDMADERDELPFIIFRRFGYEYEKGLLGPPMAMRETMHIECWADTRAETDAMEAQVVARLLAANLYPGGGDTDGTDADVKVRAGTIMVDVWTFYPLAD
jgi:hypothetical protein